MADRFDVVIVGGGTAGCVLAARLSEDADRRVLVLEAGPDHGGVDRLPDDLRSAQSPAYSHDWGLRSEAVGGRRAIRLPRAMVTGGCSATNAAVAVRGAPADYDRWVELGAAGWSWAEVLPWFRALERDLDFVEGFHGADGPLPVRRYQPDELSPVQSAVLRGAVEVGHAHVEDHNRPGALGAGPAPTNAVDGVRVSTAMAYLWPASSRPNLTVRSGDLVSKVQFDGDRAVGVELASGEEVGAGVVVLAAGAYCSPAVLLRSGVGARDLLTRAGIEVRVDLPAVGENLQDHAMVPLAWHAAAEVAGGPTFQTLITFAPNAGGAPTLQLLPASAATRPDDAAATWALTAAVLKPRSRGHVRLDTDHPGHALCIDIAHLDDEADLDRLREGVDAARAVAATDALAHLTSGGEINGLPVTDAPDFDTTARQMVTTYHHPAGTCAMGTDVHGSVVDRSGKVHETENLYVADASVMPEIPSANTNLPTIMIAERIADGLRSQ
jgi:choline dehydrogenase